MADPTADPAAFAALSLAEIDETAGELHRRIGAALRRIGEPRADGPGGEGLAPRRGVAQYAALLELAAATFASVAAGVTPPGGRYDRHAAAVAAVMYATPTIAALLARLEQDRRLLASHARGMEARLDESRTTAWGAAPLRRLLAEAMIVEAARCALALERHLASLDASV